MSKGRYLRRAAVVTAVSLMCLTSVEPMVAQAASFPEEYVNHKKPLKNATLRVGLSSDGAFKGIFIPLLANDANTGRLSAPGRTDLISSDDDGKYVNGGFADVKFDKQQKTALISISKKARWSDGEPVTSRDAAFTYELVANKDSTSPYYSDTLENIEGMKEYHEGKAPKIAGLEEKDSKHLLIHFKEMTPATEYDGSGYLINDAEPYHYLKDIPMAKLAENDRVRKHPLFFGPYQVKKIVTGESIEWVPNKYYGGHKPKLAKIITEVVPLEQTAAAMKAHKYDVLIDTPSAVYEKIKHDKSLVTLGDISPDFTYLGFKVGHADKNGKSVMDSSLPMSNQALRQAVAYAMNNAAVAKKYGHGVTTHANTLISPSYGEYHASKVKAYDFNLKKANALLDKAGFKRGKDGYRRQPNGKKLELKLLASSGTKDKDTVRTNYLQLWKKVGLNVKVYSGRALDFNNFMEVLKSNKEHDFDMWLGSWSLTPEPSSLPIFIYSPNSPLNYGHFVSKENDELTASLNSQKAFNTKYRIKQMHKWQAFMQEKAYVVPIFNMYDLETVSKKVSGMSLDSEANKYNYWDQVALTE